jgi:cytochrome c556
MNMRLSRTKITALAGVLAITTLLSAGCAAEPQSKTEACSVLKDGMLELLGDLESSQSNATRDPQASYEAIQAVSDRFAKNAENVTNDEVEDVSDDVADALSSLAESHKKFADDPESADADEMTKNADDVKSAFADMMKVCA